MSNQLTIDQLLDLVDPKNPNLLKELGAQSGLAQKLNSHLDSGLSIKSPEDQLAITSVYGTNILPEAISKTFLEFVWDALHDQTLIVLMVAAGFEIAIGIYKSASKNEHTALIDGGAIVIAILIVVLIGAVSDYRKQGQFRALNDFGKTLNQIKVVRNGEIVKLVSSELLVGDIIMLETGVVIPADGVLIEGFNVQTDESTMTGEPFAIEKDLVNDPFLLSGTSVVNGIGKMIIIATGVNSLNGRSLLALNVETEDTPLQQKLGNLADAIAKIAFGLAVGMIVLLLVVYLIVNRDNLSSGVKVSSDLLTLLILAVTVVVVAVPEGLPLAVTLSLAHATVQMLKDNNLVRHLAACETMGNATTICSDKTGTLTLNMMTVVEGIVVETEFEQTKKPFTKPSEGSHAEQVVKLIACSLNLNSTADETRDKDGNIVMEGSKTELALLKFTGGLGYEFKADRSSSKMIDIAPFSSEKKRMSCVAEVTTTPAMTKSMGLKENGENKHCLLFVKGASEIILRDCTKLLNQKGEIIPLTAELRTFYNNLISSYADKALRTIGAACKVMDASSFDTIGDHDSSELVLMSIFGIQDPLRDEVPLAVANCQSAGVVVRMVTGDSAPTARAIARGCGILTADGLVMEGPEFRKLSETEMNSIIPRLQVLARSSPLDKQILVQNLKRLGETVAVTGDGTNDAPALAAADVGFSMGIAGTEVAKEASDIILMDDNFASIVKAVLWGRCVYDAIRKFLQFQLSVNVSAVVITIVTSIYTTVQGPKKPESVLTAVQLLWVNLIMDTMAALALATDDPTPELLKRKPSKRTDPIVNADMFKQILGQAFYQIIVCLVLYFKTPEWFPDGRKGEEVPASGFVGATVVFNTFIFCQLFNEINSRSISRELNVFHRLLENKIFMFIFFISALFQALIVQFGGVVFTIDPNGLSWSHWLISIALGMGSLVVGFVIRLLPEFPIPRYLLPGSEPEIQQPALSNPSEAKPVVVVIGESRDTLTEKEEVVPQTTEESLAAARWKDAIHKTRVQVKVVKIFTLPLRTDPSVKPPSIRARIDAERNEKRSSTENWNTLRLYIQTASVFRRRADPSSSQLVDPRVVRNAMVNAARKRNQQQ